MGEISIETANGKYSWIRTSLPAHGSQRSRRRQKHASRRTKRKMFHTVYEHKSRRSLVPINNSIPNEKQIQECCEKSKKGSEAQERCRSGWNIHWGATSWSRANKHTALRNMETLQRDQLYPAGLEPSILVPIHRRGYKSDPKSYRPIPLLSHARKAIGGGIAEILMEMHKYSESLLGFQRFTDT